MGIDATYMVDTSALARFPNPAVSAILAPLFAAGRVATCGIIDLEVLYSARNRADMMALRRERRGFVQVPILPADFERALDVMTLLARLGQHRSARIPDLLLAATTERAGLCLLHYDQDFDRIAEVTGQWAEWVVPRGSL
ncbi:MAG: PIN domain nuclease [Chloroflexota bacterium]